MARDDRLKIRKGGRHFFWKYFISSDLVKTIYLVTALPVVFRTLLKNWTSGRSGL